MTNKDEDQDWTDALAGKPNADADPEVTRRATSLRQAILRHDAVLGANDFDVESGLQKLQFRLRREGLGGESKPAFYSNRFVQYAMAASIVLTVGLTMRLYMYEQPPQNEAAIVRGNAQQIILAAAPESRLKQLTTELDQLGIKYQIERKAGKILLKVQGVDPVKDDVANFLEKNHIKPPAGIDVELEIRQLVNP
jgi:hypothetical protein